MYYIQNQISPHFFYYPAELMLRKGFDVEVLTKLYPERNESVSEINNNIKIKRFPKTTAKFCAQSFKYMLRKDYALIHLHSIGVLEDYVPWIVSRMKGTPMVFTSHDPGLLENRPDMKGKIFKKSLRIGDSERSVFVAFTNFQADLYMSYGIENIEIIPHGIDPTAFDIDKNYEVAKKYGLEENNILCVANLESRKGQHLLIESMPEILKNHPKTKLLLVGRFFWEYQREYLKMLKLKIDKMGLEKNVAFLVDVPKDELIQLYLLSDVFALPTEAEAWGLVFLEAMAAGLPVISTDRPYIREILQNGDAGLLIEREQKEFEKGIVNLLNDKNLRNRLRENGRKTIEKKYRLDTVVEKHWELYSSLLYS